jgi:hypothetical protein
MRFLVASWVAWSVLASPGAAQAPETAPFDATVRLIYESDTRAYYRPCG